MLKVREEKYQRWLENLDFGTWGNSLQITGKCSMSFHPIRFNVATRAIAARFMFDLI